MYLVEKFKRPNKFGGKCAGCDRWIESGDGHLGRDEDASKWLVVCTPCANGEPIVDTPVAEVAADEFPLTDEQEHIVEQFNTGESLVVQAGAGTGKTTTLVALANSTTRNGTFIAFNKDIVTSARKKLPKNVQAFTGHGLAYATVGKQYSKRLKDSKRLKSHEIAKWLGVKSFSWQFAGEVHTLTPGALGAYVRQAILKFCASADREPNAATHLPHITGLDQAGSWDRRNRLCKQLQPIIEKAWADINDVNGVLPFSHDHYFKIWALGTPQIPGEFILVDEAQDSNPVLIDAVQRQNKQTVWVGDSQQQIYDWRGAVDALTSTGVANVAFLRKSFRFGPEVAEVANAILSTIESAELRLIGQGAPGSTGPTNNPNAVICRTNAGAIGAVLAARAAGLTAALVGKNEDIAYFVRSVIDLQNGRKTEHPELACFGSWREVEEFVQNDPAGEELALWVNLFGKFSPEDVLSAVTGTKVEDADVVVTTAHKSKGLEWDTVQLCGDFPQADPEKGKELTDSDRRLLYVASTRARKHLDFEDCAAVADLIYGR